MDTYPLTAPPPEDSEEPIEEELLEEELPVEEPETEETPEEAPPEPIDLNTATKTALVSLPRIGRILAQRIIEARPIHSLEDLASIRGFSPAAIEELRPLVTISLPEGEPAPQEEAAPEAALEETHPTRLAAESIEALEEDLLEEAEPAAEAPLEAESAAEPPAEVSPEAEAAAEELERLEEAVLGEEDTEDLGVLPEPPQAETEAPAETAETPPPAPAVSAGISRTHAWWLAFVSSLATLVLAVIFSLAVMAGINGGLRYAGPQDIWQVSRQVDDINQNVGSLQRDVEGLRERLDSLEALAGRVDGLEMQTSGLEEDLEALDKSLAGMEEGLDALDESVTDLQTQVEELGQEQDAFQSFFQELGMLIDQFFSAREEGRIAPATPSPLPETATPTQQTPAPTPSATPTPAP